MLPALWFVTKIFKDFFPFSAILLPWQPEFLLELNSFNNSCRASPKEHSCQVLSRLAFWFWRRRFLKKMLTDGWTDGRTDGRTDAGRWPVTVAPPEHVVLRWAKKWVKYFRNLLVSALLLWHSLLKHVACSCWLVPILGPVTHWLDLVPCMLQWYLYLDVWSVEIYKTVAPDHDWLPVPKLLLLLMPSFLVTEIRIYNPFTLHFWDLKTLNPFPNKPWFLRVCSTSLLKTPREKEKLLIMSNFSFSQCFLPIWRTFCHFHPIWNCRLQTLSIWKSPKFVVWERVNPFQNNRFLDCSKMKEFAHDYLKLDKPGWK